MEPSKAFPGGGRQHSSHGERWLGRRGGRGHSSVATVPIPNVDKSEELGKSGDEKGGSKILILRFFLSMEPLKRAILELYGSVY